MQAYADCPGVASLYSTPLFVQTIMSATVRFYTSEGFVIAADGRSSLGDRDDTEIETDEDVKIFQAHARGVDIAYAINGYVGRGVGQAAYNLISAASAQAEKLSPRQFKDCHEYVSVFSRNLKRYIGESKRDGLIHEFPKNDRLGHENQGLIANLFVVGYANGWPCWIDAHFHHRNQGALSVRMSAQRVVPGLAESCGSDVIRELIERGDPRFSQYQDRIHGIALRTATLETAADFAKAVISSQSPAGYRSRPVVQACW